MSAVITWLMAQNNPILISLRIGALLAVWSRVLACRRDQPPWSYVGVLLYLAVGLSWSTITHLLLTLDLIQPHRYEYLAMPALYLLYVAVIVFFLTDRRRVLARREAVECQLRRAEELVERTGSR